jgi:hypothetical protein
LFKEEEGKQREKKMHWEIKISVLLVYLAYISIVKL